MPRNVRNFWLELTVDGKTSRVETGPKAKDGGFRLVILQRDRGSIIRAMEVSGFVTSQGDLKLTAELVPQGPKAAANYSGGALGEVSIRRITER